MGYEEIHNNLGPWNCPLGSKPIVISETSHRPSAIRNRQILNHFELTSDRLLYRNWTLDAFVDLVECAKHKPTNIWITSDRFGCLTGQSIYIRRPMDGYLPASVATQPGLMDRVLIPSGANSAWYLAMTLFMPAFAALYPTTLAIPVIRLKSTSPLGLDMKMIFFSCPFRMRPKKQLIT